MISKFSCLIGGDVEMGFVGVKRLWDGFADEVGGVGSKRRERLSRRSMLIGGEIVEI